MIGLKSNIYCSSLSLHLCSLIHMWGKGWMRECRCLMGRWRRYRDLFCLRGWVDGKGKKGENAHILDEARGKCKNIFRGEGRERNQRKRGKKRETECFAVLFFFVLLFFAKNLNTCTHSFTYACPDTVSFSRLLSQYSTIFHSLTHPPNHPFPCTQNIFPICIRHVLFSITNRKLKIFQLVQKFLTENINIEGSGLQARQSQLYIGEFQTF